MNQTHLRRRTAVTFYLQDLQFGCDRASEEYTAAVGCTNGTPIISDSRFPPFADGVAGCVGYGNGRTEHQKARTINEARSAIGGNWKWKASENSAITRTEEMGNMTRNKRTTYVVIKRNLTRIPAIYYYKMAIPRDR